MEAVPGTGKLVSHRVSSASVWTFSRAVGTAESHHSTETTSWGRHATLLEHSDTALVLGSTQDISDIDADAARVRRISVVRRRSGGGAVFLQPGESVWVDIVIARSDPLWTDDVSASSMWLGGVWKSVLESIGKNDVAVHGGAMKRTPFSRTVCFDGLAPGEVTCGIAKIVGISQRRTREGARFQCVVYRRWDTGAWRDCLSSPDARRALDEVNVDLVDVSGEDLFALFSRFLSDV